MSTVTGNRVVICGATGFIGRNLAEHFAGKDDCRAVGVYHRRPPYDLEGLEWVQADLTRAGDVDRIAAGADVIIQAAATTSGAKDIVTQPHIHTTDNAVMNSLLLRSAFDHKVAQFIFFSCSVMYQPSARPLREDDFDPGQELFPNYFASGWTKIYIEKMCEFYSGISDTRFTVVRHANIFGPHDKFDLERGHVFGATMAKVMAANDGDAITVWGSGEEGRDLLYASDLVDFVKSALERQKEPFGLYNVGSGEAIAVKDLVRKIIAASGKDLSIEHDLAQPTIPTTLSLDCGKAYKALGWAPQVSLDEGISRTLGWYGKTISGG